MVVVECCPLSNGETGVGRHGQKEEKRCLGLFGQFQNAHNSERTLAFTRRQRGQISLSKECLKTKGGIFKSGVAFVFTSSNNQIDMNNMHGTFNLILRRRFGGACPSPFYFFLLEKNEQEKDSQTRVLHFFQAYLIWGIGPHMKARGGGDL